MSAATFLCSASLPLASCNKVAHHITYSLPLHLTRELSVNMLPHDRCMSAPAYTDIPAALKSSPRKATVSATRGFACANDISNYQTEYLDLFNEMKDLIVGPMPVDEFLNSFMRPSTGNVPSDKFFMRKKGSLANPGSTDDEFVCPLSSKALFVVWTLMTYYFLDRGNEKYRNIQEPGVCQYII